MLTGYLKYQQKTRSLRSIRLLANLIGIRLLSAILVFAAKRVS